MNESVETNISHRRRRYYSPFLEYNDDSNNTTAQTAAAMIILNTPIPSIDDSNTATNVFQILWNSSSFHVCADGGANRLYDATRTSTTTSTTTAVDDLYLPDLITGDLDSLRTDVRTYYEERGVKIVQVVDQDYHDLDKSLMIIDSQNNNQRQESSTISNDGTAIMYKTFIYGGFGGRFDQEMACINTLYSWGCKESFRLTQMSIWNEETGVILLPKDPVMNEIMICFPGLNEEYDKGIDESDGDETDKDRITIIGEGPTCGLIPIGGRCEKVYTTGLKWNLNGDMPLEFGGLVSSSNRIVERLVTVRTSSPLLFSFEIVRRLSR